MQSKDIFELIEDLNKAIVKDVAKITHTFKSLSNYVEKVKYAETIVLQNNIIPDYPMRIEKNTKKSIELRQKGNAYFLKNTPSNFYLALITYNEGLSYCNDPALLNLFYGNRSAVYFQIKMYRMCLSNILLVRNSNCCSDDLLEKLTKRANRCNIEIEKYTKNDDNNNNNGGGGAGGRSLEDQYNEYEIAKLTYPKNTRLPFISNCLELYDDEVFGRYVRTTKNLIPGDIIAIEKPYAKILLDSSKYTRCTNCLLENHLNLIPCQYCTSAMFCNELCQKQAWTKFHQYECSIIDFLFKYFNKIHLAGLRVTLNAFYNYSKSRSRSTQAQAYNNVNDDNNNNNNKNDDQHFQQWIANVKAHENCTVFDEFITNDKSGRQSDNADDDDDEEHNELHQNYLPIYALATNESKRSIADLWSRFIITAIINHILLKYSDIGKVLFKHNNTIYSNVFTELLYRHIMISAINFHNINTVEDVQTTLDTRDFGTGAYAFCSLLNHSCAPNVTRCSTANMEEMVIVIRPIKKGDQLFDNYGEHHCVKESSARCTSLKKQYYFQCTCEACTFHYPLYQHLEKHKYNEKPDEIISEKDVQCLMDCNKAIALKHFHRCTKYLNKYYRYYPCLELDKAQECFKRCADILYNRIPLIMLLK